MRCLWASPLGLVLVWLGAQAWAAQPGQAPAGQSAADLGVFLGRPEIAPAAETAPTRFPVRTDRAINQTSFATRRPLIRLQSPESLEPPEITARPMPAGDFSTSTTVTVNSDFAAGETPEKIAAPVTSSSNPHTGDSGDSFADCCDGPGICGCCCYPTNCCFYGSLEYLAWWTKGVNLPALVTTSPFVQGQPMQSSGILGQPGTVILFGNENIDPGVLSGGRVTIGYWFNHCKEWGLEGSAFVLGQGTTTFDANSNQYPVLARPFFNQNLNQEDAELTARPDLGAGSVHIQNTTKLWGAEINLRRNLCCDPCSCWKFGWLAGVRYIDLSEGLTIQEHLQPTVEPFTGANVFVADDFGTRNQFYGGQLGFTTECSLTEKWSLGLTGKVAVGATHQVINIAGGQLVVPAVGPISSTTAGGLLALPSNSGHFSRDRFAVVPEIGVTLNYQITENLKAFVGYNFLYISSVVRPADQIDRVIDVRQIPGPPFPGSNIPVSPSHPLMPFKSTDFWAQGVSFGLSYNF